MKSQVEIKDKKSIDAMLEKAEYGTLALSHNDRPYSVPINFVFHQDVVYFHGSKQGRKMDYIRANQYASMSIVEPFSVIPSYFSSTEGLACPATHFFRSLSIEGEIEIVTEYDEKVLALQVLMEKFQPEGAYRSLDDKVYKKRVEATEVFKLIPSDIKGKVKLAQHLPIERFEMILEHLEKRGDILDKLTVLAMKNALRERA